MGRIKNRKVVEEADGVVAEVVIMEEDREVTIQLEQMAMIMVQQMQRKSVG